MPQGAGTLAEKGPYVVRQGNGGDLMRHRRAMDPIRFQRVRQPPIALNIPGGMEEWGTPEVPHGHCLLYTSDAADDM
eukprot:12584315-Alexandrium_andersonii.AAC.1